MKKIIPVLIIGVLVLSGLGAAAINDEQTIHTISESIALSEPTINNMKNYVEIDLAEATSRLMGEGKPDLPVVTKVYTFPSGTKIEDVKVTFSETYELIISKDIKPASVPEYISTELADKTEKNTEKPKDLYSKETIYPEKGFTYNTGAGLDHGEHVLFLSVHLCPISYNPSENILRLRDNANIEITYKKPSDPITIGDDYDLLIITPSEFSEELQPLVDHKNTNGIATTLVTLEDIPSQGSDEQEDIKYFIKNAYEDWGITYVLLVGSGVVGIEKFPVRNAWVASGSYESYFPSDLYYADFYNAAMGFSDWDFDNDGKYA